MSYKIWMNKIDMIIRNATFEQKDSRHFPCNYAEGYRNEITPNAMVGIAMKI